MNGMNSKTEGNALETDDCIVGGGPAGMTLAHILARCGVRVTLLERHDDFDRDFRGDTIHAGVMEVFDQLELSDQILNLPRQKIRNLSIGGIPFLRDLRPQFIAFGSGGRTRIELDEYL